MNGEILQEYKESQTHCVEKEFKNNPLLIPVIARMPYNYTRFVPRPTQNTHLSALFRLTYHEMPYKGMQVYI